LDPFSVDEELEGDETLVEVVGIHNELFDEFLIGGNLHQSSDEPGVPEGSLLHI
jgi:hypothetical protein